MKIKLKNPVEFGELLIRKGLSKRGFAEVAAIGQVTALQIVNGDRAPSPKMALKIAEALEVEWNSIFIIEHSAKTPIAQ